MRNLLFAALAVLWLARPAPAFETAAGYALVIDGDSGLVLYEKNADQAMTPASMSKLMTILLVFEALRDGTITEDERFYVSVDAWRRGGARSGGSTMFLKPRSRVKVIDLLRGVIVQSGNDACIVLAEGIAGTEAEFARQMTRRAQELGLDNSRFVNSTGLPHPDHKMTPHDLARLAQILIRDYPRYYAMFAERAFKWNRIKQENRNPLLYANIGADGLKTGHTEESGYGLVASVVQNNRRTIAVLNGLRTKRQRANEARRAMNWAYRNFSRQLFMASGDAALRVPVWHGRRSDVTLTPERAFEILLPRNARRKMAVTVTYEKPVLAPVEKGRRLATMRVTVPGLPPQEMPLVALDEIERGNMISRAFQSLGFLLTWAVTN